MRFLLINTDYRRFLRWLYDRHPGLEEREYDEQMQVRNESLFGVADYYSRSLRALGHEAWDIHPNNEAMQRAWAREHDVQLPREGERRLRLRKGFIPWPTRVADNESEWFRTTLVEQVRYYRPDVILNHDVTHVGPELMRSVKPMTRKMIGQSGPLLASMDPVEQWSFYDLFLSSFPPTVAWARAAGIPAELFRLGFERSILDRIPPADRTVPVGFVGSFFAVHSSRTALLERLASEVPLKIWGPEPADGFGASRLKECYQGIAWGREMYEVIGRSRIVINHHGDVPPYANNMRLYEATGMGALLVTDWKENLHEIFEPGREVVAYRSADECVELVKYYLEHDEERETIARAGQQRTLREHTYDDRMKQMVGLVERSLGCR